MTDFIQNTPNTKKHKPTTDASSSEPERKRRVDVITLSDSPSTSQDTVNRNIDSVTISDKTGTDSAQKTGLDLSPSVTTSGGQSSNSPRRVSFTTLSGSSIKLTQSQSEAGKKEPRKVAFTTLSTPNSGAATQAAQPTTQAATPTSHTAASPSNARSPRRVSFTTLSSPSNASATLAAAQPRRIALSTITEMSQNTPKASKNDTPTK